MVEPKQEHPPRNWNCVWENRRPHVHPLRTDTGDVLTIDAPADHPWHHGLWFTIKFVNGENFWEEPFEERSEERVSTGGRRERPDGGGPAGIMRDFGTLAVQRVDEVPGGVEAAIDWVRPNSPDVVMRETRTITEQSIDGGYELRWHEVLTPSVDVELDRTPFTTWGGYGGLTLRGARDWVDTVLVLPDRTEHDRLLGVPADACTLRGTTPSGRIASITITPDADHDRAPIPWYGSNRADTYGEGWANFLNAAFLWNGALSVAAGTPLTLAYRISVTTE